MVRIARFGIAVALSLLFLGDAAAASDCQNEALAAFARLATSGLSYRREETIRNGPYNFNDANTKKQISEGNPQVQVIPPDRMHIRTATDSTMAAFELIRVGSRIWQGVQNGNRMLWRDEEVLDESGHWSDLALSKTEIEAQLSNLMFVCLGSVEYSGESFIGYKALYSVGGVVIGEAPPREFPSNFPPANEPTLWVTIFVDPQTNMLAYEIIAKDAVLDDPKSITRYIYSADIVIQPPVQ